MSELHWGCEDSVDDAAVDVDADVVGYCSRPLFG